MSALDDVKDLNKLKPAYATKRRGNQVQNKAPAPLQITAEQILREAQERRDDQPFAAPEQKITDKEELNSYRMTKRKEFEDQLRRQRQNMGMWIRYAKWEENQKEFERARSIFERAMDIDYRTPGTWLKYAEMEMRSGFANHARNVWDRAVQLLPRVDQLWYKYAHMEETLGNMQGARTVFERWMRWKPDTNAWLSYIKLESRCSGTRDQKLGRCRQIYERLLNTHQDLDSYLRYAKWEQKNADVSRARQVYERAVDEIGEESHEAKFFLSFANMEVQAKEHDRARTIFRFALDHIPKHLAQDVYKQYTAFEKQWGDKGSIDHVILSKKRFEFEEQLKDNDKDYDVWFDYIKLEEQNGDKKRIRETFERAIAQVPPLQQKIYWRRYIYIWIKYAVFEELVSKDVERAQMVFQECLNTIPHELFTFSKIWLMFAHFHIRRHQLAECRQLLGEAVGKCPKIKLFNGYIELELQLGNVDRCRRLYEKLLEFAPENCFAWTKFAELEKSLDEIDRCRHIFELAVAREILDMPEVLWKSYIDFELEQGEHARVRALYDRLLAKTQHLKVWISRAQFEAGIENTQGARDVFTKADKHFKQLGDDHKEERVMLLEAWRDFERQWGNQETNKAIKDKLPRRIKKKRKILDDAGNEAGWEEFYDYIFPDSDGKAPALKILERAKAWKLAKKRKLEQQLQEATQ